MLRETAASLLNMSFVSLRSNTSEPKSRLVHLNVEGADNRTIPCMEANYPYAIKNQRGASK